MPSSFVVNMLGFCDRAYLTSLSPSADFKLLPILTIDTKRSFSCLVRSYLDMDE